MHHVLDLRLKSVNRKWFVICPFIAALLLTSCATFSKKTPNGSNPEEIDSTSKQEVPTLPEPVPTSSPQRESLGPPEPEVVKQVILIASPGYLQSFDVIGVIEALEKANYPIVGFIGSDLSLLFAATYGIRRSRSDVEWLSLKLNEEAMFGNDVIKNLLRPWPKSLDSFEAFLKKEAKVSDLLPSQLRFKVVPWKQTSKESSMTDILMANMEMNGVFESKGYNKLQVTEGDIRSGIEQLAKDFPKAVKICLDHDLGISLSNKDTSEKRKSHYSEQVEAIVSKWKQVVPEMCDLVLRPNFDGIDPFLPEAFERKNQLSQQSRNLLKNKIQELEKLSENKTK